MNYRFIRALLVVLVLIAAVAGFGSYMYQLGVAHGTAVPRPWGFGFGFFPFFPLLFFVLFWIFAARALFWRRRWHYGPYGYYGRSGRYGCRSRDIPPRTTYL